MIDEMVLDPEKIQIEFFIIPWVSLQRIRVIKDWNFIPNNSFILGALINECVT
jgi:hypothetical protein